MMSTANRTHKIKPLAELSTSTNNTPMLLPCASKIVVEIKEDEELVGNFCYICGKEMWSHEIIHYG